MASTAEIENLTEVINYDEGLLLLTGSAFERIPPILAETYGQKTRKAEFPCNQLTSLQGLENFPYLEELNVDGNMLNDQIRFPFMPRLHTLSLNKNNICDLCNLCFMLSERCPRLRYLSLHGNPVCPSQVIGDTGRDEEDQYQKYRYYVIFRLRSLRFLDSRPVTSREHSDAIQEGPRISISRIRPQSDQGSTEWSPLSFMNLLRPPPEEGQATFERLRMKYSGKNSEGNRFIRNNDL